MHKNATHVQHVRMNSSVMSVPLMTTCTNDLVMSLLFVPQLAAVRRLHEEGLPEEPDGCSEGGVGGLELSLGGGQTLGKNA